MSKDKQIQFLQTQLAQQTAISQTLSSQLNKTQLLVENLQAQLETLLRKLYGKKSEKQSSDADDNEANNFLSNKRKEKTTDNDKKSNASSSNGRKPLPADLPRIKVRHEIPEQERCCKLCGRIQQCMGKCVTEQLDYMPAQLVVKAHVRYKYHCPCNPNAIVTAPMPNQPIDKGLAGAGLLADVLIAKYQDAMPLYRQSQRFTRHGINIADTTLCDWVKQCAFLLSPIVDAMRKDLLLSKKIHTDDTPLPVLHKGKTKKGRLWVYLTQGINTPACAIYDYTPTRSKSAPEKFLGDYRGYLQADAYAGYDALYKEKDIIEVGCMAHARRKFFDVAQASKGVSHAHDVLDLMSKLYEIERQTKVLNHDERYYYRKRHAKPWLKALHRLLTQLKTRAVPNTPFDKALDYSLNHWIALARYLAAGFLDIDNNAAERAIKPLVIGRKNYMFAGSHEGGKRAAIIYSLIETCKMNGINTLEYLTDVLTKLPSTKQKDINFLLPYNWQSKL